MTTKLPPICIFCTHFTGSVTKGWVCEAFPAGIPEEIAYEDVDHRQPYPGDHGIRFEPKDKDAAEYAEYLFPDGDQQ
jgi:hypothetical protein